MRGIGGAVTLALFPPPPNRARKTPPLQLLVLLLLTFLSRHWWVEGDELLEWGSGLEKVNVLDRLRTDLVQE